MFFTALFISVFGEYEGNEDNDDNDEDEDGVDDTGESNNRKVFDITLENFDGKGNGETQYKYPNRDGEYHRNNQGQK